MANIKCEYCEAVYDSKEYKNICPSCGARNQYEEPHIALTITREIIGEIKDASYRKQIAREKRRKKRLIKLFLTILFIIVVALLSSL